MKLSNLIKLSVILSLSVNSVQADFTPALNEYSSLPKWGNFTTATMGPDDGGGRANLCHLFL